MQTFRQYITELTKPAGLSDLKNKLDSKVDKVDARNSSWVGSVVDYLASFEFKKIGSGKYASVFAHPKYPYALKIFMKDSAYLRWIEFAQSNQSNPYVPKLRGKVVKITSNVFAIRIEKLKRVSGSAYSKFDEEYRKCISDKNYTSDDENLNDVFAEFKKNKKLLDLHGENVMSRGSQLVVLDPYYNWFGKKEPGKFMIDPNEINTSVF